MATTFSIRLMGNIMATVSFSYSHAEAPFRKEPQKHLAQMVRNGEIKTWHDRMIRTGNEFETENGFSPVLRKILTLIKNMKNWANPIYSSNRPYPLIR